MKYAVRDGSIASLPISLRLWSPISGRAERTCHFKGLGRFGGRDDHNGTPWICGKQSGQPFEFRAIPEVQVQKDQIHPV